MVDINATDFIESFDISKATVGLIGYGFIGKAVDAFFKRRCGNIVVHDKAMPEKGSLRDVVERAEVIFVAVPTPMRKDGSCYTGFVEEVIRSVRDTAREIQRNLSSFVLVVKSTVYPGFIEDMQSKYLPMRLVFSPEFLTEKNSVEDFKKVNRIIAGGDEDDAKVVLKYFLDADPEPVREGRRVLLQCDPSVAEMTKLFANGMLTMKVIFSNEVYLICEKLGVDYSEVRQLAGLDSRVGFAHTVVPGPDGDLGYGGHCFPKDIQSLRAIARELQTGERLMTAAIERNSEIRKNKDWEQMKDRAVTEN